MSLDRRKVLTGFVATSAIGLTGTAAGALSVKPGVMQPGTRGNPMAAELVVTASDLRISSAGRAAPTRGEGALLSAELEIAGSEASGSLHGFYRAIASPGVVGDAAPTSIETHHFILPNGTLVGTGTGSLDDNEDNFVVLGGTGAYAGASGSYAAAQRPLGLGGDGTATYRFALLSHQGS